MHPHIQTQTIEQVKLENLKKGWKHKVHGSDRKYKIEKNYNKKIHLNMLNEDFMHWKKNCWTFYFSEEKSPVFDNV